MCSNPGFVVAHPFDACPDFAGKTSRLARSIDLDSASWMRDGDLSDLRHLDSSDPLRARAKPTCCRGLGFPWSSRHDNPAKSCGNHDSFYPETAFVLAKKESEVNLAFKGTRTECYRRRSPQNLAADNSSCEPD